MTLIALTIIKFFNISYPISVTTSNVSKELSVVGEGKVEAVPDTARVDVGVTVNNATTAREAQAQITKINNDIIKALLKMGVAKKDIQTTNVSIYPNYNYDRGTNDITGYNGNATLNVKVREVDKASNIVDEATKNGANNVNGPYFTIDNPDRFREEARNLAIKNAREQAQKLANSLGIKLGKIVNIVEASQGSPILYDRMAATAEGMGGGGSPSYEPGTQTITSVVTLYFEKR